MFVYRSMEKLSSTGSFFVHKMYFPPRKLNTLYSNIFNQQYFISKKMFFVTIFFMLIYVRFAESVMLSLTPASNDSQSTLSRPLGLSPYILPKPIENFQQEQNWLHIRDSDISSLREPNLLGQNSIAVLNQTHRSGLRTNSSRKDEEMFEQINKWLIEFRDMTRTVTQKQSRNNSDDLMSSASSFTSDDQDVSTSELSGSSDDEIEAGQAGTTQEPQCARTGHAGSGGRYYCTSKEDYPLKLVTEVTKYYKWPLEKLFRDLHAQIMPKLAQESTGNLVCDSITRVVRPGWARNTNDRWLVVINTENYHQYVTEVVCQYGSNSRCNFMPPCYYSTCQQRFNTQKLLVIDPNNPYRGPFLSEFLFPSCCVCYVPSVTTAGIEDKYGKMASPTTIYQQTLQQVSQSNIYPPAIPRPNANVVPPSVVSVKVDPPAPASGNPGEIRRDGESVYKDLSTSSSGLNDFPRFKIQSRGPANQESLE